MSQHLTDQDRADLARILHEAIEADRYPFSPKVRRLKELLAKIDPSRSRLHILARRLDAVAPEARLLVW